MDWFLWSVVSQSDCGRSPCQRALRASDALLTTILCFCHHRRRRAMSVMSARDRRLRRFRRGRRTACIRRLRLRRRAAAAATVSSL